MKIAGISGLTTPTPTSAPRFGSESTASPSPSEDSLNLSEHKPNMESPKAAARSFSQRWGDAFSEAKRMCREKLQDEKGFCYEGFWKGEFFNNSIEKIIGKIITPLQLLHTVAELLIIALVGLGKGFFFGR